MLILKIIDQFGKVKAEYKGIEINAIYNGNLNDGDKIKITLDGCFYIKIKLDDTLEESLVYVPNKSFEFVIPSSAQSSSRTRRRRCSIVPERLFQSGGSSS